MATITGLYSDFVLMTNPEEKSATSANINQAIAGAIAAMQLVKTYTKKKGAGSKKRKAPEEQPEEASTTATAEGTLIGPPLGLSVKISHIFLEEIILMNPL